MAVGDTQSNNIFRLYPTVEGVHKGLLYFNGKRRSKDPILIITHHIILTIYNAPPLYKNLRGFKISIRCPQFQVSNESEVTLEARQVAF